MNLLHLIAESSTTSQPTADQRTTLFNAACLAVGGVAGWLLNALKARAEIAKLRAEVVTEAGKTLKEVQDHRRQYIDATKECADSIIELTDLVRSGTADGSEIRAARNRFCAAVGDNAIPRFQELVEWEYLDHKTEPEELKNFVECQVAPELKKFDNWLRAVNNDGFLNKMQLSPYRLSIGTVQPFLKFLTKLAPSDRATLEPGIKQSIASLRGATT